VAVLLGWLWWSVPSSAVAEPPASSDVFASFTRHIQLQIRSDKQSFAEAHTCTEWFYKQNGKKSTRPPAQGVSMPAERETLRPVFEVSQCQTRYPGGLDAARQDFSRTQSFLTVSLTFYEFALVGDRNDDGSYSAAELQDILSSFGLAFDEAHDQGIPLAALNAQFDQLHKAVGLDVLMTSMGILYDKGYRFTSTDRDEVNRISG
jgi:hypothetical protein